MRRRINRDMATPQEAREVAILDDLAMAFITVIYAPASPPTRRIVPSVDLFDVSSDAQEVHDAISFRKALDAIFSRRLVLAEAPVHEEIQSWLLDVWTATAYGPAVRIGPTRSGEPALFTKSEFKGTHNIDGVEDIVIDLRGEENVAKLGINDFFLNYDDRRRKVEVWLGPMRLVQVSCQASSNAVWRNKHTTQAGGSSTAGALSIGHPSLDGVDVQRVAAFGRRIASGEMLRVYYGPSFDSDCTCPKHVALREAEEAEGVARLEEEEDEPHRKRPRLGVIAVDPDEEDDEVVSVQHRRPVQNMTARRLSARRILSPSPPPQPQALLPDSFTGRQFEPPTPTPTSSTTSPLNTVSALRASSEQLHTQPTPPLSSPEPDTAQPGRDRDRTSNSRQHPTPLFVNTPLSSDASSAPSTTVLLQTPQIQEPLPILAYDDTYSITPKLEHPPEEPVSNFKPVTAYQLVLPSNVNLAGAAPMPTHDSIQPPGSFESTLAGSITSSSTSRHGATRIDGSEAQRGAPAAIPQACQPKLTRDSVPRPAHKRTRSGSVVLPQQKAKSSVSRPTTPDPSGAIIAADMWPPTESATRSTTLVYGGEEAAAPKDRNTPRTLEECQKVLESTRRDMNWQEKRIAQIERIMAALEGAIESKDRQIREERTERERLCIENEKLQKQIDTLTSKANRSHSTSSVAGPKSLKTAKQKMAIHELLSGGVSGDSVPVKGSGNSPRTSPTVSSNRAVSKSTAVTGRFWRNSGDK